MIQRCKPGEIDQVMNIWLQTNIEAHSFIPKEKWYTHFDEVKARLPLAEVFVYKEEGQIKGFIGIAE